MWTLLLAAAALPTAVQAEYAFARDAQRIGQWTAFRKYAQRDAVMFNPQAVWAHEFLKDRKDPPKSVEWWPAESYVSCDGRTAVNTGPWRNTARKSNGYFTTVWLREKGRWQWVYDGGEAVNKPIAIPRRPKVRRAACGRHAKGPPLIVPPPAKRFGMGPPDDYGRGQSADRSLGWDWKVDAKGARHFRAMLWNGRRYELVIDQNVAGE
jgi:hypothetical protein